MNTNLLVEKEVLLKLIERKIEYMEKLFVLAQLIEETQANIDKMETGEDLEDLPEGNEDDYDQDVASRLP